MLKLLEIALQGHFAIKYTFAISQCYIALLLSQGQTVVKRICECNQSGRGVVFYPEPVAMSRTWRRVECLLHRKHVVIVKDGAKVISRVLPQILLRNCGNSHQSKLSRRIQSWRALFCITA